MIRGEKSWPFFKSEMAKQKPKTKRNEPKRSKKKGPMGRHETADRQRGAWGGGLLMNVDQLIID